MALIQLFSRTASGGQQLISLPPRIAREAGALDDVDLLDLRHHMR
jgi:hypothetical protein